jgi:hypothetical protein
MKLNINYSHILILAGRVGGQEKNQNSPNNSGSLS